MPDLESGSSTSEEIHQRTSGSIAPTNALQSPFPVASKMERTCSRVSVNIVLVWILRTIRRIKIPVADDMRLVFFSRVLTSYRSWDN